MLRTITILIVSLGVTAGSLSAADAPTTNPVLLPDLAYRTVPGSPAQPSVLPPGVDVFTPPIHHQAPVADSAAIAACTDVAHPDESIALTGDKLSMFSDDDEGRDTRFLVYGQTTAGNGSTDTAT